MIIFPVLFAPITRLHLLKQWTIIWPKDNAPKLPKVNLGYRWMAWLSHSHEYKWVFMVCDWEFFFFGGGVEQKILHLQIWRSCGQLSKQYDSTSLQRSSDHWVNRCLIEFFNFPGKRKAHTVLGTYHMTFGTSVYIF